jgi:hypothetical protein
MSKNQQQPPQQKAGAVEKQGPSEEKQPLTARLKFKRQVELNGAVYRPDGGEGKDGVYTISLETAESWGWYGEALVKDGDIVQVESPLDVDANAVQSSAQDAAAAVAAAAKVNAENGKPMSDEQKAAAEATERANKANTELMQQAASKD